MRSRRGMSAVVTTLLIILLALVAVGIVWVVVKNLISKGIDEVSLASVTLDMEIKKALVEEDALNIVVKRNSGEGDLVGINFVFSDGDNSEVIRRDTSLKELGTQTFTFDLTLLDVGTITSISIVPIFKTSSGKEATTSSPIDEIVSDKGNLGSGGFNPPEGLISWWRFEGDAQDEIGGNHGTINGDVQFVEGKYGQGASFAGVIGAYIETGVTAEEFPTDSFTIMAWANSVSNSQHMTIAGVAGANPNPLALFYLQRDHPSHGNDWYFIVANEYGTEHGDSFGTSVNDGQWYHIAGVYDDSSQEIELFVDGIGTGSPTTLLEARDTADSNMLIGASYYSDFITDYYQGIIDEVMLFNRALTDEEIERIYNTELG